MCLASRHFFANAKVILVGDFNAVTHSATIQKLSERAPLSSAQLLAGLYFEVKSVKYIITCAKECHLHHKGLGAAQLFKMVTPTEIFCRG